VVYSNRHDAVDATCQDLITEGPAGRQFGAPVGSQGFLDDLLVSDHVGEVLKFILGARTGISQNRWKLLLVLSSFQTGEFRNCPGQAGKRQVNAGR